MSTFADQQESAPRDVAAPTTVVLHPDDFASTWEKRPNQDVAVGLRLLPNGVDEIARREAARLAWEAVPRPEDRDDRYTQYSEEIVRWLVAKATCDPNNVDEPYFEHAEDTIKEALTSSGIRKVFDAYERLVIETGFTDEPIQDNDIEELARLLATGALYQLAPAKQLRSRKLLSFVRSELATQE